MTIDLSKVQLGRSGPSPWDKKRLSLLAPQVAGVLPNPPSSISVGRSNFFRNLIWTMMGNDHYGDCVIAAAGHRVQGDTSYEKKGYTPSDADVVKLYLDLNNNQDNGMYLLDALKPWQQVGFWGHKLAAYAEVPWTDASLTAAQSLKLLKLSVWLTGGAYVAFNLPAGLQQNPGDWTKVGTGTQWRAGTWGGHCIEMPLYQAPGSTGSSPIFYGVTWGHLVPISVPFLRAYMDEAWMAVSEDWQNIHGNTPTGRPLAELTKLAQQIGA